MLRLGTGVNITQQQ